MSGKLVIEKAKWANYTNSTGATLAHGTMVLVGMNWGVLRGPVADGATGQVKIAGVIKVTKTANTEAFAEGDKVYFNGQEPTKVPYGFSAGYVYKAASASATSVYIVLTPGIKDYYVKRPLTAAEVTALTATLSSPLFTVKSTTINAAIMSDETTSRSSTTTTIAAGSITLANSGIVTGDMVRCFVKF